MAVASNVHRCFGVQYSTYICSSQKEVCEMPLSSARLCLLGLGALLRIFRERPSEEIARSVAMIDVKNRTHDEICMLWLFLKVLLIRRVTVT